MQHLPDEKMYPCLAEFLRAGGKLEVGEDRSLGSFARLRIGNTTLDVVKPTYQDFPDVLREMESQARRYCLGGQAAIPIRMPFGSQLWVQFGQ